MAIKGQVLPALAQYPSLRYVVIVGDDSIIPFYRVPDEVSIANEGEYRDRAGVAETTPLHASLDEGYTLTDDYYVDVSPFAWYGRELYVPDYPMGRLVEQPDEIVGLMDVFLKAGGLATPETGLVVGYDFLTDSALQIKGTLEDQGIAARSLISDTWTAEEMRDAALGLRSDISSLNAHFEHWHAWSADLESGDFTSSDVDGTATDLQGSVVFSVGCHAGLSVPDAWERPPVPPNIGGPGGRLDFSQAWARKGATWIANTGYGYGMDDSVAFSELLMSYFAQELGRALLRAKQRYFNNMGPSSYSLYDEKIMIEATLFGLPMFQVQVPVPFPRPPFPPTLGGQGGGQQRTPAGQIRYHSLAVSEANLSELLSQTVVIRPEFQEVDTAYGRYFTADGEAQSLPGRPIQPRTGRDIAVEGTQAHGALLLEARFVDLSGFDPVISRPVTDTALSEPEFVQEGWSPAQWWTINRLPIAGGALERLVVIAGQFRNPGVERLYQQMSFEVYYSREDDTTPPAIWSSEASRGQDQVMFSVDVSDPSGVLRVLVTYEVGNGQWRSADLVRDPASGFWRGQVSMPAGPMVYFVQAVDGAGNVAVGANKGFFFEPTRYHLYLPLVIWDTAGTDQHR